MGTIVKGEHIRAARGRWLSWAMVAVVLLARLDMAGAEAGRQREGGCDTTAVLEQVRARSQQLRELPPWHVRGKCRIERGGGESVTCNVAFFRSKSGWAAFYAEEQAAAQQLAQESFFGQAAREADERHAAETLKGVGYRELAIIQPTNDDIMIMRPGVYWRGGLPFGQDLTLFDFCHLVVLLPWYDAGKISTELAKQVQLSLKEEAGGTVRYELLAVPGADGPPTTKSLGWKKFRNGTCVEWGWPGWTEGACRDFSGIYGRAEGPFDPATSFPRTIQLTFLPERGNCEELTTVTVELGAPEFGDVGRIHEVMDPATLRREGWAAIEPAEAYRLFRWRMKVLLGARHLTPWSDVWPFPHEEERPLGTLRVRLSGAQVQKLHVGEVAGGQFWGLLEVINDRDVPTTITTLLREIWLYGTVYSVIPDKWMPVRLEPWEHLRTVIHLEPHKDQGADTFFIYLGCDDGKNQAERQYSLQASCVVVPPVAVKGLGKAVRRPKSSCGVAEGLWVHVEKEVRGEPRLTVVAPHCMEPKLQLQGTLGAGKSVALKVPVCWEIPRERQGERLWVRIIGYDDSLQPGSGWVVVEPEGQVLPTSVP